MTATVPKIPDPLVVLKRAERAATGEEPGDLSHLADAVRTQIVEPLTAGGAPVVDDVQVKQLLADKQRLEGVVAELRKTATARDKGAEAQAREVADLKRQLDAADEDTRRRIDAAVSALETPLRAAQDEVDKLRAALTLRTQELDEVRAERDTARAQLRDRPTPGVDASLLDQAQRDNARLADELACARRDLTYANNLLDEIADDEASHPAAVHRCSHVVTEPGAEPAPCECGKPWPRSADAYTVEDEQNIDVEPWAEVFDQIRAEAAEAGWTA